MLSSEGNENGGKTAIGLISKKATWHVQHTFCTFLCRWFARLQRETSRNFLVTRFLEERSYLSSFSFLSLPLVFTLHWWSLAFLMLSPPVCDLFSWFSDSKTVSFNSSTGGARMISSEFGSTFSRIFPRFPAKITSHLGCHTCWLSYFTLVCLWCGPIVGGRDVGLLSRDYQIFWDG